MPAGAGALCLMDAANLAGLMQSLPNFDPVGQTQAIVDAIGQIPWIGGAVAGVLQKWVTPISQAITTGALCTEAAVPVAVRFVFSAIDKWIGELPEAKRVLTYAINNLCQTELPSLADAQAASLANVIDDDQWRFWVTANGLCEPHARLLRSAARRKPEYLDLLRLWLRQYYNEGQVDDGLRALGWLDQGEREAIKQFAQELPNPSDLVRFAVRHVFEPSLANKFGFSDELNPNFVDWHAKLGFGYDVPIQDPIDGQQYVINWATAQWWSHWVWPAPGQAVQAGFRFRPGRDTSWEDGDTAALSVDQGTVSLLLRGNDYPPQFRPIIQGLGRPLPGLRQLANAVQTGAVDRAQVYESFRKQGYSDRWSNALANGIMRKGAQQRLAEAMRGAGGVIGGAWEVGSISDDDYKQFLSGIGLDQEQVATAQAIAQVKYQEARVKEFTRAIRSGFNRGFWSKEQALAGLQAAGMVEERATQLVADWEFLRVGRRREIGAAQLVKDALNGIITVADYAQRLFNLDFSAEDVALKLSELGVLINERQLKLLQQSQNLAAKSRKAAEQQLRQAAQALRNSQTALAKHGTPAELAKWYWEQTIPLEEVYARLNYIGWPDPDIARLITEHEPKQKKTGAAAGVGGASSGTPPGG